MTMISKRYFLLSILCAGLLGSALTVGTVWLLSSTVVSDDMRSRGMSMHQIPPQTTVPEMSLLSANPYITLRNSAHEDTDGGRESAIIAKGFQSGGEESTLAKIVMSHHGSGDEEYGGIHFHVNRGGEGDSPSESLMLNSGGVSQFSAAAGPTIRMNRDSTGTTLGLFQYAFSGSPLADVYGLGNLSTPTGAGLVFRVTPAGGGLTQAMKLDLTGEAEFSFGLVPVSKTADPCGSGFPTGSIFFNATANTWCGCDGTNDVKLVDGSACF